MRKILSIIRKIINFFLWVILILFLGSIAITYINDTYFVKRPPVNHTDKLSNHYEKYENQIIELVDFVAKNNTKNIKFQIEFEDEYSKFWFRIKSEQKYCNGFDCNRTAKDILLQAKRENSPTHNPYAINRNKDEFLQILGWSNETLNLLKDKLKEANCISYEHKFHGDNFATIGIYRTFLDMYFFKIYDNNVSKNEILKQTDDCLLKYYKDNVVFEFGQSAITSGCGFP